MVRRGLLLRRDRAQPFSKRKMSSSAIVLPRGRGRASPGQLMVRKLYLHGPYLTYAYQPVCRDAPWVLSWSYRVCAGRAAGSEVGVARQREGMSSTWVTPPGDLHPVFFACRPQVHEAPGSMLPRVGGPPRCRPGGVAPPRTASELDAKPDETD